MSSAGLGSLHGHGCNYLHGRAHRQATADALFEGGYTGVRLRRLAVPDEHVPIAPPAALYAHYRLDADGIAGELAKLLDD